MKFPIVSITFHESVDPDVPFMILQKLLKPEMATFQELMNFVVKIPGANISLDWVEGDRCEMPLGTIWRCPGHPPKPKVTGFQLSVPFNDLKIPPKG